MRESKINHVAFVQIGFIIFFGSIASYAVVSRAVHIAAFLGLLGQEKTEMAVISEMSSGKNQHFVMIKQDGKSFELKPRSEHFRQYQIGDTIQTKYNSLLPNLAYIGSNGYLIVQSLITIAFWSFLICLGIYQGNKGKYIEKFKAKMHPEPSQND